MAVILAIAYVYGVRRRAVRSYLGRMSISRKYMYMLSGLMVLLPRRTDWWYQATVAAVVGVREGPGTVMCEQLVARRGVVLNAYMRPGTPQRQGERRAVTNIRHLAGTVAGRRPYEEHGAICGVTLNRAPPRIPAR